MSIHLSLTRSAMYIAGGDRPSAGRVHAAGQQRDGERAVRSLPHQDIQEDGLAHRQCCQSGLYLF